MNLILFAQDELSPVKAEAPGGELFLGSIPRRDSRAQHLLKVLHKKPGEPFDAGVLGGKLGSALITALDESFLSFSLAADTEPPPRTPLRLGVGFPRPIQLRRLLRDCASLGLAAVDLAGTDLGEKSYRDTKLLEDGGAFSVLVEGAAQARDTRLPRLALYPSLAAWLESALAPLMPPTEAASGPMFLMAAADNAAPQGSFADLGPVEAAVLAVGPERGWSSREREQLEAAGFRRLSLGKRALRTETACTAAAIILMEKMGLL